MNLQNISDEEKEALHIACVSGSFTIEDLRVAFKQGQKSKKPELSYEPYGDMEAFASSKITYSFDEWIDNYR